jgi:hypothetical protein
MELGAPGRPATGPEHQQPVTGQLLIGPDRPDDLVVDHLLDREPGQRPTLGTLGGVAGGPTAAGSGGRWRVGWPHFLVAPLHSSTCRRGNRSDAAKLVRSGCSLHPTATRVRRRPGRVHRRPARERRRDGCGHQRPGPAHRRCGRAGQRLARARPGHLGFGQGCGASGQPGLGRLQRLFGLRARASAARTRASSSALAATRSRWTSWTSSWATSASLRDDDRTRPAGGGTPGRT